MRWQPQVVLRTRVGRRFVLYFILSALVPIALFGYLAERSVSSALTTQAGERVRRGAKDAGIALHQQLLTLDEQLRTRIQTIRGAEALRWTDPRIAQVRTQAVTATLSAAGQSRVQRGEPLLHFAQAPHGGTLSLVRALPPDSTGVIDSVAVAELRVAQLVGGASGYDLVPPASRLCLAMEGRALACVASPDAAPEGDAALVGESRAFFRYVFGAPDLVLRMHEYEVAALAPLQKFRTLFVPVAIGAVMLAALLAQVTIRRQTEPLAALHDGTTRIARRDFSTTVPVQSDDEFGELASSFNGMTAQLDRQWQALEMRHQVDVAVLAARTRTEVADVVLSRIHHVVPCEHAQMLLALPAGGGMWEWRSRMRRGGTWQQERAFPDAEEVQELRAQTDGFSLVFHTDSRSYLSDIGDANRALRSAAIFPVVVGGCAEGALVLSFADETGLDAEDERRVRQLASQVAVAFSNLNLVDDLRSLNRGALEALARTTDANSPWTAGHSVRVTGIAVALADAAGLDEATVDQVRQGALLHDIGKLAVPPAILDKPGRLTDEERAVVETHPVVGERILRPVEAFAPLLPMVRSHHERWDGAGYPDQLRGEEIHPLARLLAVADVVESLLSARPYRAGLPLSQVVEMVSDGAGRHFDPQFANLFVQEVRAGHAALLAALWQSSGGSERIAAADAAPPHSPAPPALALAGASHVRSADLVETV